MSQYGRTNKCSRWSYSGNKLNMCSKSNSSKSSKCSKFNSSKCSKFNSSKCSKSNSSKCNKSKSCKSFISVNCSKKSCLGSSSSPVVAKSLSVELLGLSSLQSPRATNHLALFLCPPPRVWETSINRYPIEISYSPNYLR